MAKKIDLNNIPSHIAIIMDGNGRWAKRHMLTRSAGHKAGAQALKKLAPEIEKLGVKYLTVYAFSTENWKRPKEEVNFLMELLRDYIQQYIDDVKKNNMKISIIGERNCLDKDLRERISHLENLTKEKMGLNIVIALNYGGRDEIIRAVKAMVKNGCSEKNITEENLASYLDTSGLPDPELIIRTSGELRTSNFLIWQSAYSELYFTDKLWPDFNIGDLLSAINQYQQRERRFGGR